MVKITLFQGNILYLKVDCVVNEVNSSGKSILPNIHSMAGNTLREECKVLGKIPIGTAKLTHGHNLFAKYIIHVTGLEKYKNNEDFKVLANCYYNILDIAEEYGNKTIALYCIGSTTDFDRDIAAKVAVTSVKKWLVEHKLSKITQIIFSLETSRDMDIYRKHVKTYLSS